MLRRSGSGAVGRAGRADDRRWPGRAGPTDGPPTAPGCPDPGAQQWQIAPTYGSAACRGSRSTATGWCSATRGVNRVRGTWSARGATRCGSVPWSRPVMAGPPEASARTERSAARPLVCAADGRARCATVDRCATRPGCAGRSWSRTHAARPETRLTPARVAARTARDVTHTPRRTAAGVPEPRRAQGYRPRIWCASATRRTPIVSAASRSVTRLGARQRGDRRVAREHAVLESLVRSPPRSTSTPGSPAPTRSRRRRRRRRWRGCPGTTTMPRSARTRSPSVVVGPLAPSTTQRALTPRRGVARR